MLNTKDLTQQACNIMSTFTITKSKRSHTKVQGLRGTAGRHERMYECVSERERSYIVVLKRSK